MKRSYEQLKLYHALIKQIKKLDVVKIQLDTKEWRGCLRNVRDCRYLLKILDMDLSTKNKAFPDKSKNKNRFDVADVNDLTQHISWLREVLYDNHIIPFNDKGLENE